MNRRQRQRGQVALSCLLLLAAMGTAIAPAYAASTATQIAAYTDTALDGELRELTARLEHEADAAGAAALQDLLAERAALLSEAALRRPAAAASYALSQRTRAALALRVPGADRYLETDATWTGYVQSLIQDDFQTGSHATVLQVVNGEGTRTVRFAGGQPRAGQQVQLSGIAFGASIVATKWSPVADTASLIGGRPQRIALESAKTVSGTVKLGVYMIGTPQHPLKTTPERMRKLLLDPNDSADQYVREVSGGRASLSVDVHGPYELKSDNESPNYPFLLAQTVPATDYAKYDAVLFVMTSTLPGQGLNDGGGSSSLGPQALFTPGGVLQVAQIRLADITMNDDSYGLYAVTHELQHALGIDHASILYYPDEPVGPVGHHSPVRMSTIFREYGDPYSIMGAYKGHLSAPHKAAFGWLREGTGYRNVSSDGSYTLQPYADKTDNLKAIRVKRGDAALWLEFRTPLAGTADADYMLPGFRQGAQIHYEDLVANADRPKKSYLLHFGAREPNLIPAEAQALLPGEVWNDPYSNLTLEIGARGDAGLPVKVSYRPVDTLSATLDASKVAADGGTLTLQIANTGGKSWKVLSSAGWASVDGAAEGKGDGAVRVRIAASDSAYPRTAALNVNGVIAVVHQDPVAGTISFSPRTISAPAKGMAGVIEISASAEDFEWACPPRTGWLSIVALPHTVGSQKLRYYVQPNQTTQPRSGTITLNNETFVVVQEAGGPHIVPDIVLDPVAVANGPVARLDATFTAFEGGQALLFGGRTASGEFAAYTDTWLWTGSGWQEQSGTAHPGYRFAASMAYDPIRKQAVLFGGVDPERGVINET
ncbi:MAG TPA: BACON domain-containing carbohydrate-binding protein, partial [Burkholderiaceae bacterium]